MLSIRRERVGNACGIQISCVKTEKQTKQKQKQQTNKQKRTAFCDCDYFFVCNINISY